MKAPTDHVIEAMLSLEDNHHFKQIKQWFAESLQDTTINLRTERDDVELRRLQGSASELNEILDLANNARKIVADRRAQKR